VDIVPVLPLIRRWWWTLLVAAWSAAIVGFLLASRIPPTYSATATMLVGPFNTDNETLRASQQLVPTFSALAESPAVIRQVEAKTGLDLRPGSNEPAIRATGNDTTRIISIRAELPTAQDAATAAQGVADQMVALAVQDVTRPEGELRIIDPATASTTPAAPNISLLVLLAAAAGLLAAAVVAFVIESLSPSVRSADEAERVTDAPVVAHIRDARRPSADPLSKGALPPMDPGYGLAAARLLARDDISTILVAAPKPKEGTGEFALDLARAIAATGQVVTIVSADHAAIHAPGGQFLVPVAEQLDIGTPVSDVPGVVVTSVARPGEQPSEVLARAAGGGQRVVIIDGGAADGSTAALRWAGLADITLLVVRDGRTDRRSLSDASEAVRIAGAPLVGLVILGFAAGRRTTVTDVLRRAVPPPADPLASAPASGPELRSRAGQEPRALPGPAEDAAAGPPGARRRRGPRGGVPGGVSASQQTDGG
jgi:capsular polysaccharide biosynthesis protein